ncbi:lysozyme [Silvibacterium acidisoli]|uniref:lysozyme n=1 Tax=Acidobacteriaceae bacterium ZG23-2 TaxID=2883246 RepID=UPI00406C3151
MAVNNLAYSKNGLALTELFEGDILTAYQDQAGVWTIGYGHTEGVKPGQTISRAEAEAFLMEDLKIATAGVNEAVRISLTQSEFDALVDFTFNMGAGAFRRSSLLKDVNNGNFPAAIRQFRLWDHCGGVVNEGLLRRRYAEAKEFENMAGAAS